MKQTYDFPADTAILEKIGKLVTDAGSSAGFNDIEIGDIQLALDEVCTNTIIHGLKNDLSRTFQMVLQWDPGEIEIQIHESGELFNPLDFDDPNLENIMEEQSEGGLGLYFLRKLMDEADFRIGQGGVKTWRIVKRKAQRENQSLQP
ncbi:MAG: ATP-binding protein [Deltaproteobacteria bacterium]|nr:ATP-binding protein [Deltaproteobacteria bacterium]